MAYDQSVRGLLTQNGVDNNNIGYDVNRNMVTVNGHDFMQPQKNYNGTTFTDQPTFNQAWSQYQQNYGPKPSPQSVAASNPSSVPGLNPSTSVGQSVSTPDYGTQINGTLQQLMHMNQQNQQPIDIYNSPQYQAAQAQMARQTGLDTRQAQEALGESGFGRSTNLTDRIQHIQTDNNNYLNTQLAPAIYNQLYNQRQQQFANLGTILGALQTQQNNQFNQGIAQANLTGHYVPAGAQNIINQIIQDKQNYAQNPDYYSNDANVERQKLAQMGIDPSQFGSDVTLQQAQQNAADVGSPTMAYQQMLADLTGKFNGQYTAPYQLQLSGLTGIYNNNPTLAAQSVKAQQQLALAQLQAEQAYRQASLGIESQNASTQAMNAQTEAYRNDPNNPINQALMDYYTGRGNYYNSGTTAQAKDNMDSTYVSNIDQMTPQMRSQFFQDQKANIIKDLGVSGYNQLYSMYMDPTTGLPKQNFLQNNP